MTRRDNPGTSFSWALDLFPQDRGTLAISSKPATGWIGYSASLPSGLPLGGELRIRTARDGLYLVTSHRFATLQLDMHRKPLPGRWVVYPEHDWTNDLKIAEYVARYAMSRGAGSRLGAVANRQFNGYLARAATCTKTNRVMVDVRDWASAKDWSVEETAEPGYLTLRKGTRWAVIPSAAASIKVDGQWRAIPDLVMVKSGRWMFPVSSADGI